MISEELSEKYLEWIEDYIHANNIPRDLNNSEYAKIYSEVKRRINCVMGDIEKFCCCRAREEYAGLISLLPDEEQKEERFILENI